MTDRVENMVSNKGNKIANQFVIYTDNGSIFQSYNSTIVKLDSGKTYLDINKWDYSKTTGKYRNIFLNEKKKKSERLKALKMYEERNNKNRNKCFFYQCAGQIKNKAKKKQENIKYLKLKSFFSLGFLQILSYLNFFVSIIIFFFF